MQRRWLVALAVLLLTASVFTPMALASQDESTASEYSIEELRDGGKSISEEYPSVRRSGQEAWWVVRYPPSGLNSYGGGDKEYLSSTSTVRRDKVRIFSSDMDAAGTTETFRIVYWTEKQVPVENSSSTRTVAKIHDTQTAEVSFSGSFRPRGDLPLKKIFDDEVRVTAWSTDRPDELRWTFRVQTIATAQPVNLESANELYGWLFWWNFLPGIAMLGAVSVGIPRIRKAAGAGPQRLGTLLGGGLFMSGVLFVVGYVQLASLVAAIPLVFPATLAYVAGVVLLHDSEPVRRIGLVQLNTSEVQSPLDEDSDILDAIDGEIRGYDVVEMPNDDLALYESGFKPFWARLHGCYTKLNIPNKESRIDVSGDYDELILVDEERETLIDHQPESVLFKWPWKTFSVDDEDDDLDGTELQKASVFPEALGPSEYIKTAGIATVFGLSCFAAEQFLGTWLWGTPVVLPLAMLVATPVKGTAHTQVAPGQARKAYTTAFYADFSVKRFQTVPDLLREIQNLTNQNLDVKQMLQEMGDESVMRRSNDPDASPLKSDIIDEDPAIDEDSDSLRERANGGDD